ncbi:MAG: MlaD family protein [Nitriliruptorales bacterium]|nr:MlaD family protein [Nitriliruptorales bacterium]
MTRIRLPIAVVAVAAVLLGGCSLLGGSGNYEITAEFSRAFNLFPGSEVRVLGLAVGQVADVEARRGSDVVTATLVLPEDLSLPADVEAFIIQGALLGERYVELTPAYEGGERFEPGDTIPLDRTGVPSEFDEILESLNDFLDALPPEELARFVSNVAEILEGRGEELGRTLEDVGGAVAALEDADDELVALIGRLADLNETLATRDTEIGALIDDYGALIGMLADERELIDSTLTESARMVSALRELADDHLDHLEGDVEAVTRFGRTLDRNLPQIELLIHGQSELYRHARRVFDLERNWLPLVNHSEDVGRMFQERLTDRLVALCDRLELTECATASFWEGELAGEVCLPGVIACPDEGADSDAVPLDDAIDDAFETVPELEEGLEQERLTRELEEANGDLTTDVAPSLRALPGLVGVAR